MDACTSLPCSVIYFKTCLRLIAAGDTMSKILQHKSIISTVGVPRLVFYKKCTQSDGIKH